MKDAVKIAVRRRPVTAKEASDREIVAAIEQVDEKILVIDDKHFVFDEIIEPAVTQEAIYVELIQPMVKKLLNGFICTVLAYGQTGTGKTYTMGLETSPDDESAGIIPRTLTDIFKMQRANDDEAFSISVSFIEIYMDQVYDLLSDDEKQLNVKGQKFTNGNMRRVESLDDAQQILQDVYKYKKRHVRSTNMNSQSSRSHAIFTIKVEKRSGDKTTHSALHLVDLAGSEGVRRTNHEGAALNEGVHINQGLLCISKVIHALSQGSKVIPFRDSVLTSVLQDALNDKSYLTLLACISPLQKDLNETKATLNFARDTKNMKITPKISAIITNYKKSKKPIFKTPMPKKQAYGCRLPIAQSTALKRTQLPRASDSNSTFSNLPKKTRVQVPSNNTNRNDSFDDLSQTLTNANQSRISGCSSFESSLESTTSEAVQPVQPLPAIAIQKIKQLADPQPAQSISPIIRRVISEYNANFNERFNAAVDEKFKTMHQTFSTRMTELQQTVRKDVPRNDPSIENASIDMENTILLSEKMDETPIIPSEPEPEGSCSDQKAADSVMELTVLKLEPRPTIVFPYDSMENSTLNETDRFETDLTDRSFFSPKKRKENERQAVPFRPMPVLRETLRTMMRNENYVEPPELPVFVRRSTRLTILNERKQAQEEEERAREAIASSVPRIRPTIFRDVTKIVANTANKKIAKQNSHAKIQRRFVANDMQNVKQANTVNDAKEAHSQRVLNILNTGSSEQMQMLPQIGAKTAYALILHRNMTGPYTDIESLATLKFWGGKRFQNFMAYNNLE